MIQARARIILFSFPRFLDLDKKKVEVVKHLHCFRFDDLNPRKAAPFLVSHSLNCPLEIRGEGRHFDQHTIQLKFDITKERE